MNKTKRDFVRKAVGILAVPFLGTCGGLVARPVTVCPKDSRIDNPHSPLTIDVHAHLFNATDLQIERFITLVASQQIGGPFELWQAIGESLQSIGWNEAPDGDDELRVLREMEPLALACDEKELGRVLDSWSERSYQKARVGLSKAFNAPSSTDDTDLREKSYAMQEELPSTYAEYRKQFEDIDDDEMDVRRKSLLGVIRFVVEHFQYRYVSAYHYLLGYGSDVKRKVDLVIANLVDYDYWLNGGRSPPTTIAKQIQVMEKISILTGGRIHAFVPFCPYRQAVHDLTHSSGPSPLDIVKDAILNKGAIGVKLYPPMGFAPMGNAKLQIENPNLWRTKSWLQGVALREDFGERLDAALHKLYDWCAAPEIDAPITAHSNISNGPSKDFEALAGWVYWDKALNAYPNLRVSFGHFGNPSLGAASQTEGLLSLMRKNPNAGGNTYADASYFSDVIDDPQALTATLKSLLQAERNRQSGLLSSRLMYGTDWKMMLTEKGINKYLSKFGDVIAAVVRDSAAPQSFENAFFGYNASDFLGLRAGPARRRLEDFYAKNAGRLRPTWMDKVDAIGVDAKP